MTETERNQDQSRAGVLRRDAVRILEHPALVDCGSDATDGKALSVVPLLDGQRVAGFEVKCGCGNSVIVECVYTKEATRG
ncbi:MAG: hypothetical protein NXI31_04135 [bacterium]|nr:hypothetical protein [bacterium]